MRIFIGGAYNDDIPNKYKVTCKKYVSELLKNNDLVFGGARNGLMGTIYDCAKGCNSKIIASCPKIFEDSLNEIDVDEVFVTSTMIESTIYLFDRSDAIVFIPGGIGTLYELFNILQSIICKEYNIPIVIFNPNNYYDNLINMLNEMYKEKFINDDVKDLFYVSDNALDTLKYIKTKKLH